MGSFKVSSQNSNTYDKKIRKYTAMGSRMNIYGEHICGSHSEDA